MKQRLHPIELTLMIVAALALTSGAVALHTQSQLAERWCGFTYWPTPIPMRIRR